MRRLVLRLYTVLLRCYPVAFRARHGREMQRLFEARYDDAGRSRSALGKLAFLLGGLADAVRNGLAQRLEERKDGRRALSAPLEGRRIRTQRADRTGGDGMMSDVRYALRALVKSPGFTLVAVVTIGLGIGPNTAIFSVVRSVLLQPLPYEDPEELVILWGEMRTRGVVNFPSSPPDFRDYREQADLLEGLGAVFTFQQPLTGDGDPVQIAVAGVTPNFLGLLGAEPVLGRNFVDDDAAPNEQGVQPGAPGSLPQMAILSHGLWQQRWGGDRAVIGRTVDVGGAQTEIVGVLPPGFELLLPAHTGLTRVPDIWLAWRFDFDNAPRNNVFLRPVGRLRDGATREQLQAQVDRIAAGLAVDDQTKATAGYEMTVVEMQADLTEEVRPVLLALLAAVAFVLLIACANVANLLLVRASNRVREFAVRAALGGGRGRLIRQLMLEAGLLSGAGAGVGLLLAWAGVQALPALQPGDLPRIESVGMDAAVLGFTLLAAAGAALVFGVLPALQGSRFELADALKERGPSGAAGGRKLARNGVVVAEVAMSLVLLIGAGLMVRSFVALNRVHPGYEAEGVLTFNASMPQGGYPEPGSRLAFNRELQARIEAIPGVQRASAMFPLPLGGTLFNGRYGPEEALADPEAFRQAAYRAVQPGYFEAMGTRLLSGRVFEEADLADSLPVVVVDDKVASALWPDESAIGKRFLVRALTPEPDRVEVIGVVEHQRAETLASDGMEAVFFHDAYVGAFASTWVVRGGVEPLMLVGAVRSALSAVDPDVPMADVRLMTDYVDEAMGPTRFALTLIGVFGALAVVLASVGLYGVLSYVVRQRTSEIGVRMAFGAERASILRLVVGQGLGLAGAGVALGLLLALPLAGYMESLLVGVSPTDPFTYAGISGLFVLIAALACWVPARRATRVDPVSALKE